MNVSSHIQDWSIAYSPYVDTLHVYKNVFNRVPRKDQIDKDYGQFYIIFNSKDSQLLLFEMKHASKSFGKIDNMQKRHIIQRVEELVNHHG